MRLKRLVLSGFKSFADKTEFCFDANLTGIIGPNGCGKSNVVDAVKWVLGSQRPTAMRGREMFDLIFAGAEGRSASGVAEVRLVLGFEDEREEDGGSPLRTAEGCPIVEVERPELSIGRRLFRSGESEYLLNGRTVRLKDIREVMLDTGLGVGGYAVMEQGEIDAVLSANPEERRKIFDEAAGISRYKLRRREALRKLERTEQNLARVQDLRQEKASRLRSLKIQATRARTWREAAERRRALRVAVAMKESGLLEVELEGLRARLSEADLALKEAEERREDLRRRLRAEERELQGLSREVEEAREALTQKRADTRRHAEAFDAGLRKLEEIRHRRSATLQELDDLSRQIRRTRADLEALETQRTELGAELDRIEGETPEVRKAAETDRRAAQAARDRLERARQGILETMHARTRAGNEVREAETEIRNLRARAQRLEEKIGELEARGAAMRGERIAEARAAEDLRQRLERALGYLDRQKGLVEEAEEAQEAVVRRIQELADRKTETASELRLLEELESGHTGMDEAAKELLAEGEGEVRRLVEGIDCPLELGPALEAVLGPFVQALLVADREALRAAFARTAGTKGRSLCLAVRPDTEGNPKKMGESPLPGDGPLSLPAEGLPLSSFCRLDPEVEALCGDVLSRARVVADLDAAERLRGRVPERVLVTLKGEIVEGPWVRVHRLERSAGLVQRRSAILRLREDLERMNTALAAEVRLRKDLEDRLRRRMRRRARLEFLREGLARRLHAQEHRLEVLERGEKEWEARLSTEREDLEACRAQQGDSRVRMMKPLFDGFLLQRRQERFEAEQETAKEVLREVEDSVRRSQARLAELQERRAGIEAEWKGLMERRSLLRKSLEDLGGRLEQGAAATCAMEEEAESLDLRLSESLGACLAGSLEEARAVTRLESATARRSELLRGRETSRRDEERMEREVEEAREERTKLRMKEKETSFALMELERRMREECGVELARLAGKVEGYGLWAPEPILGPPLPEDAGIRQRVLDSSLKGPLAPPDFYLAEQSLPRLWEEEGFDLGEARKECELLSNKIARMGSVNLAAEEELEREEEESEQLEKDCKDLEAARRNLWETIREINQRSKDLFERTFAEARRNFQEIFRILFQGGRADIRLVETEDPLEAGIEILAQPPGKELQSIRLLSGGERSLTALAILFALFKVKPSPFCILDEVDAALDETNVERFLRVLGQFTEKTQFLVITHHKRTMVACQVLYGVTMPRKGVSARMSVRLEDVRSGRVDRVLETPGTPGAGRRRASPPAGIPSRDRGAAETLGADPAGARRRIAGEEKLGFELD